MSDSILLKTDSPDLSVLCQLQKTCFVLYSHFLIQSFAFVFSAKHHHSKLLHRVRVHFVHICCPVRSGEVVHCSLWCNIDNILQLVMHQASYCEQVCGVFRHVCNVT